MASENDDIVNALPPPPPPAPVRRDAAIGEAMRRYDGRAEAPRALPVRPEREKPRTRFHRPQLGILVAASLVAVIGVPLAWRTATQKTSFEVAPASRSAADLKTFDVADAPPPPEAPPAKSPTNLSERRDLAAAPPPPPAAVSEKIEEPRPSARAMQPSSESANVQQGIVAAPMLAAPPPPIMAAAPPAPAKPPDEKASADNFSIVVTGARKRSRAAERGDWNSCTINDPRQDLSACRSLIDPSAKGDKGQADAHLADGLLFAWQGNADRAIAAFDQAIAIAPKSTLALLNRGLAHQKQGDSEQALADFNLAIKLAPDDPKLYYNRGLLLREQGDIKRARPDQRRATDLDDSYDTIDPERRGR